jgi:Xaa-Pro aminopeptidase
MNSSFTPDFFQGNRQRLRELFTGTAPIVLTGNGLLQRSTSETHPFKQDGNFWYLTGIDEPNVILVMDKNKEYIIAPELSHYQEVFDGSLSAEQITARSGIATVLSGKAGWALLETRLKKVKHVATISAPAAFVETYGMYTNPARAKLIRTLKKSNPNLELLDLSQHLQRMRMVKQPVEIDAISQAIKATIGGLKYVEKKFRNGQYAHEFDVKLDLDRQFWKKGAPGHSFDPVVASGERGLIMHVADKAELDPKKQLLLDVGAEYQHYAADISRTWMVEPTKRFETVYAAVLEVADFAMNLLKPGVVLKDYEKQIEDFMGEKLRELGLIKIIEHDSVRHYFPHATSHFLGIDVHDVGDYGHPIEAGVVMTVEPGIYIPEEGIGVRIEDDILITADGFRNLSAKLAR